MGSNIRMFRALSVIPLFWALTSASQAVCAPVQHRSAILIPKGTEVPLVFDQALSSRTAKEGDRVALHVAENVEVGGKTIIKAGTRVSGIISRVDKNKRFGVGAKLQITLNPVHTRTGGDIPLQPKSKGKYSGSRADKAALASGGGALLLGPVGLVGGYFFVGKPVKVKVGDKLVSEVSHDVTLR